jgi:hypothetical protein
MQGLMYTARFSSTESLAQDFLTLGPVLTPDIVIVHSVRIGQSTLAGDASAEMAEIQLARAAAIGSGGASVTPEAHMVGAPAASTAARTSDTTPAATPVIVLSDTFNLQAGWLYLPTPEERIVLSSTATLDVFVVTLPNAVTSAGFAGSITFEEILG